MQDRLRRLSSILRATTGIEDEEGGEGGGGRVGATARHDFPRAIKILDKLAALNITMTDLVKSGIGKTIVSLRKHKDSKISDRATQLRAQWKEVVNSENKRRDQLEAKGPVVVTLPVAGHQSSSSGQQDTGTSNTNNNATATTTSASNPAAVIRATSSGSNGSSSNTGTNAPSPTKQPQQQPQQQQHPVRTRAVRLLRTAAGNNQGDVVFRIEEAALHTYGVGDPKYFQFITRTAFYIKKQLEAGSESITVDQAVAKDANTIQHWIDEGKAMVLSLY
mmetsp:Transcript_18580/g.31268  ORF Transcript_18580/g.31268 Transcript_18580/m.31268 type:complete len:277 (-) Transcript_18580:1234-2064(-)